MRILCLTPRYPYPVIGGDKLRISKILEFLAREHTVSLLSFVQRGGGIDTPVEPPAIFERVETVEIDQRRARWMAGLACLRGKPAQVGYYTHRGMRETFRRMVREGAYDAVLGHLIRVAQYITEFPGLKVLEMTDAVSMTYGRAARYLPFPRNLAFRLESALTLRYEGWAARRVDRCVLVSDVDADYEHRMTGESNFRVTPNGVDGDAIPYHDPPVDSREIVFLGNMRTAANTDAVVYFTRMILPSIRARIPHAVFTIVGNAPPPPVQALARFPGVTVTGHVPDPFVFLRKAALQVAPIRIAGGVQNKLLESMAAGTPVITSTTGAEGIDAVPGEHFLVEDDPGSFAEAAVRLLNDPAKRLQLARRGREFVDKNYRWEDKLKPYGEIFREARGKPGG